MLYVAVLSSNMFTQRLLFGYCEKIFNSKALYFNIKIVMDFCNRFCCSLLIYIDQINFYQGIFIKKKRCMIEYAADCD